MAADHRTDEHEAFEREVRAALRRRAGDPAERPDALRVAIDGTSPPDAHRQRMLAVLLCLVVLSLVATLVAQVL